MLICLVNLSVSLVHIFSCLDSILLGVLDHRVLSLYDLSHIGEHSSKLGKSSLDALELIVTSTDGAKNG